jgi:hypothetical protein
MTHDRGVVDLIERAQDSTPYCHCGSHTSPLERDGVVWLDCAKLAEPPAGTFQRLLNTLVPHIHTRIVDLRAA